MSKLELIRKANEMFEIETNDKLAILDFKALMKKIAEPDKVIVPKFIEVFLNPSDTYAKREVTDIPYMLKMAYSKNEDSRFVKQFDWIRNNPVEYVMAVRNGFIPEAEAKYYAKIKGHEFINVQTILDDDTGEDVSEWNRHIYFIQQMDGNVVLDMKDSGLNGAKHFMTLKEWSDLGINDVNADFERVIK